MSAINLSDLATGTMELVENTNPFLDSPFTSALDPEILEQLPSLEELQDAKPEHVVELVKFLYDQGTHLGGGVALDVNRFTADALKVIIDAGPIFTDGADNRGPHT